MIGRVVAVVLTLLVGGGLIEWQYRANYVEVSFERALLADPNVQSEMAAAKGKTRHYPIVDIANGLLPSCQRTDNCFSIGDYSNVDTVIGLSPNIAIPGVVKVLANCDKQPCLPLQNSALFITPASQAEMQRYSVAVREDQDTCSKMIIGLYTASFCRQSETIAGVPSASYFWIGEPYPTFLPILVLSPSSSIATVYIDYVTSRSIVRKF